MAKKSAADIRNLVTNDFAWLKKKAESIASTLRVRDHDGAVGAALAHLVSKVAEAYDGRTSFRTFAALCMRRKIIDCLRSERWRTSIDGDGERLGLCEIIQDERAPAAVCRMCDRLVGLSDRDATLVWLAYCRGMSRDAISELLGIPVGTVKSSLSNILAKSPRWLIRE